MKKIKMRFVIPIAPVTKKNHQQIRRTKDGRCFIAQSEQYRQYALCHRVQRPCMADLSLSEDSPQLRYYVMGCVSLFFIYVDNAVVHLISPLCLPFLFGTKE